MKLSLVTLTAILTACVSAAPAVDGGKNNNNPDDGKASNEANDNKGIEVSALNNVNIDAAQDLLNQLNVLLSGLFKRDVTETEDGILGKREELAVGDLLTQVQGLVSHLTDAVSGLLQGADNLPLVGDLLKQVQGLLGGLTGGSLAKRQDLPAGELLTQVQGLLKQLVGALEGVLQGTGDIPLVGDLLKEVQGLLGGLLAKRGGPGHGGVNALDGILHDPLDIGKRNDA